MRNTKEYVFVSVDSAQAEARVIFLLADDEKALKDIDEHDYHALTASWFFGGTENDHSKKILGYETPIRFAGKTLRHAGHLGAGKRRAAISVNTDARRFKVNIHITEAVAERALKIFHAKQPKIQQVFQNGIIKQLEQNRTLIAGLPYGIDAPIGGKRIFFERWGDELFRQAFSYIPQRSISDNTKAAAIRTKQQFRECRIIMESHDGLLFSLRREYLNDFTPIIKREMERPIDFTGCSLKRRHLKIPAEIEVGDTYLDLKKFRVPEIAKVTEPIRMKPMTIQERMEAGAIELPKDEYNPKAEMILHGQELEALKKNKFLIEG